MEPIYQKTVWAYRCLRCPGESHEWLPRKPWEGDEPPPLDQRPRVCPKCKNPYWDREKQQPKSEG